MNSKLHRNCFTLREVAPTVGTLESELVSKTSLRDQAVLLLSIADIAQSELTTCPSALFEDSSFPSFPALEGNAHPKLLAPQTKSLRGLLYSANINQKKSRLRTVSIDSPILGFVGDRRTPSPLASPPTLPLGLVEASTSTPIVGRLSHRSARQSHKARHERVFELEDKKRETIAPIFSTPPKSKALQGKPPEGVTIKKILRRKFSWKNYPELEQFLIANREQYLRHSALNYTLQQKQYNNRLSEQLLELASEYGYIFDEKEFSFVTVRDRIRCYYKSFVQSAKKRGILMGYAARKAGLLTEDDLEQSVGDEGLIITPN